MIIDGECAYCHKLAAFVVWVGDELGPKLSPWMSKGGAHFVCEAHYTSERDKYPYSSWPIRSQRAVAWITAMKLIGENL